MTLRFIRTAALACIALVTGSACTAIPDGMEPVAGFDADRYLGTWYEVARLDHSFERGLYNVTATYARNDDGSISVLNRGYSEEDAEWNSAEGKAKFVSSPDVAHLKVSFFGPFYGSYVVYDLDDEYRTAFVTGYNKKYLWLLSREPNPPASVLERFKSEAAADGYDLSGLIENVQRDDLPR